MQETTENPQTLAEKLQTFADLHQKSYSLSGSHYESRFVCPAKVLSQMRLSEGIPLKACANPQARGQNINRANLYENKMVQTDRDLNCSGACPISEKLKKAVTVAVSEEKIQERSRRQGRFSHNLLDGKCPNLGRDSILCCRNIWYQARKRNPNFWVWIFSGGVGVFYVKGWGQKVRYVPRSPGNQFFLVGYPGILPGYPGSAQKVWEKKSLGSIFGPYDH